MFGHVAASVLSWGLTPSPALAEVSHHGGKEGN